MERLEGSPGTGYDSLKLNSANVFRPDVLRHLLERMLPRFPIIGAVVFGLFGVAMIRLETHLEDGHPFPPRSPGLRGLLHCRIHQSVATARIPTAEGELYSISPLDPAGCRGANVGGIFKRAIRIERKVVP